VKINSRNHVYRYTPNYLNNRQLSQDQIVVKLKVISAPEDDAYQREALHNTRMFAPDKAQELNEARLNKLIKEKFVGVEELEIDGLTDKEIDFDTFYAEAPPEMVNEVLRAIRSTEILTQGEQKNFLPEPDGH